MKVQVLFDKAGKVHAMLHPSANERTTEANLSKMPRAIFRPREGQHSATLDVPTQLRQLGPGELHASVRVEFSKDSPRLAAIHK